MEFAKRFTFDQLEKNVKKLVRNGILDYVRQLLLKQMTIVLTKRNSECYVIQFKRRQTVLGNITSIGGF